MRNGFSLLELSIVLVIIGLLAGGVMTGQSMIRAAELRGVIIEYQRYTSAMLAFRDKYFALAGDFKNATQFWGRQASTADCVTNSAAAVTANGVCDGNGSGVINDASSSTSGVSGETLQFWRQLATAGLIEGTYSGLNTSVGNGSIPGVNVPASRFTLGGWSLRSIGKVSSPNAVVYALDYGLNSYEFGGVYPTGSSTNAPIMKPADMWNIDTKLDDGLPAQGRIVARFWNGLCSAADNGANSDSNFAASYRLSDETAQCSFYVRNVY